MNINEAIEKIENESWEYWDSSESVIETETAINILNQIDTQPKMVVIPKFVAEYIVSCKQSGWHLQKVLSRLDDDEKVGDWAYDENDNLIPEKVDMVAHAWLFGYEVEKEKKYTVKIPNPNSKGTNKFFLQKDHQTGKVFLCKGNFNPRKNKTLWLTEAEIKQDFDWAWDAGFYEPVEVEE